MIQALGNGGGQSARDAGVREEPLEGLGGGVHGHCQQSLVAREGHGGLVRPGEGVENQHFEGKEEDSCTS